MTRISRMNGAAGTRATWTKARRVRERERPNQSGSQEARKIFLTMDEHRFVFGRSWFPGLLIELSSHPRNPRYPR